MWKRSAKYWGRTWLENMGICMGMSLLLLIFFAAGSIHGTAGGASDGLRGVFFLYPYYLMLAGVFYLVVGMAAYFRSVLPMLVSVNATRRRAVLGLVLHAAAMILGITVLSALIWLTPLGNEPGAAGFLTVMAGGLFLAGAVGIVMGAVSVRWGKIGNIITIIVCAVGGGICGAGVGFFGREKAVQILKGMLDSRFLWLLALGIAVYVMAGAFALMVNRKMEVRV